MSRVGAWVLSWGMLGVWVFECLDRVGRGWWMLPAWRRVPRSTRAEAQARQAGNYPGSRTAALGGS